MEGNLLFRSTELEGNLVVNDLQMKESCNNDHIYRTNQIEILPICLKRFRGGGIVLKVPIRQVRPYIFDCKGFKERQKYGI